MNRELSYRLARKLGTVTVAVWIPPLFAAIGLAMVLAYVFGGSDDGGVLGFGVANLVLSLHLLTVRGIGKLLGETQTQIQAAQEH